MVGGTGMVSFRTLATAICVTISVAAVEAAGSQASEDATIVSDQVRSQGYDCTEPVSAMPDTNGSRPDEQAYILECGNATYRVRLVPDQAAEVSKIK